MSWDLKGFLLGSQITSYLWVHPGILGVPLGIVGMSQEQRTDIRGAMNVYVGLWESSLDFVGEPRNLGGISGLCGDISGIVGALPGILGLSVSGP